MNSRFLAPRQKPSVLHIVFRRYFRVLLKMNLTVPGFPPCLALFLINTFLYFWDTWVVSLCSRPFSNVVDGDARGLILCFVVRLIFLWYRLFDAKEPPEVVVTNFFSTCHLLERIASGYIISLNYSEHFFVLTILFFFLKNTLYSTSIELVIL